MVTSKKPKKKATGMSAKRRQKPKKQPKRKQ